MLAAWHARDADARKESVQWPIKWPAIHSAMGVCDKISLWGRQIDALANASAAPLRHTRHSVLNSITDRPYRRAIVRMAQA